MPILFENKTFQTLAAYRPAELQRAVTSTPLALQLLRNYAAHRSPGPNTLPVMYSWHLGNAEWGWVWCGPLEYEAAEGWRMELRVAGHPSHALIYSFEHDRLELGFMHGADSYGGDKDHDIVSQLYDTLLSGREIRWLVADPARG